MRTDDVLSDRALRWAGTMAGHGDRTAIVRRAHADSSARLGPAGCLGREEREAIEDVQLAPGATRSVGAGDRARPEVPDAERTCFERDRDRILHSAPFRRLAGKTQVFVFPDDHQRTRLTHALEVAQVATAVARACRLNVALTEAIALGHDCGHGPGGHASEDALTPYLPEGFDHAVWGADVVLAPANLCRQTSDGIRNHSWSRPAPATPEGEVVSWADRIAYVCHDFEDAVHAGIVTEEVLPRSVIERCGISRSRQLGAFIEGLVVGTQSSGQVGMSEPQADALAQFRECNYERIYLRPSSAAQGAAVVSLLRALVEHFSDRPNLLPAVGSSTADAGSADACGLGDGGAGDGWVGVTVDAGTEAAVRAAVTYVAGMTDRFACQTAVAQLGWDRSRLPRSAVTM